MSNRGPGLSHMWRISKSAELGSSFTGPIFERNTTVAAKGKWKKFFFLLQYIKVEFLRGQQIELIYICFAFKISWVLLEGPILFYICSFWLLQSQKSELKNNLNKLNLSTPQDLYYVGSLVQKAPQTKFCLFTMWAD